MNTRQKELTELLKKAAKAYYQEGVEIMDNYTYDKLYDELMALEKESGITFSGSPTVAVGYEVANELPKVKHESPMLSLDKTKDPEIFKAFIGNNRTLLSWKLDGLTIVLTYQNGELVKAVTRGNGLIGEDVTSNAKVFKNVPLKIPFKGKLVLRGEAIITYSDFNRINTEIGNTDSIYKNPRNLCSGSVRQLSSEIAAKRNIRFYAFSLVDAHNANVDFKNSREQQLKWLESLGFDVVDFCVVTANTFDAAMKFFETAIKTNDFPSDGLVALYDDIMFGESLGKTSKYPKDSFAFKWADEQVETVLKYVDWCPSRTGLINPVAVFEPVEIEGTTVGRASVHNISAVKSLMLGQGDHLLVYKANMIIPQISENLTRSNSIKIPATCPACKGRTGIRYSNNVETLYCENPDCPAKKIKAFSLFTSRDAMNISGLSEATLEKFIGKGLIKEFSDIFKLESKKEEVISIDGFGEASFNCIVESINKARTTVLSRVIYGLGIQNVGLVTAKALSKQFNDDIEAIRSASVAELLSIDAIGPTIANNVFTWFQNKENQEMLDRLMAQLNVIKEAVSGKTELSGKTFAITGNLNYFSNRSELVIFIAKMGGKVSGLVSGRIDYLITNDTTHLSAKLKKALELGVKIISEDEFMDMAMDEEERNRFERS